MVEEGLLIGTVVHGAALVELINVTAVNLWFEFLFQHDLRIFVCDAGVHRNCSLSFLEIHYGTLGMQVVLRTFMGLLIQILLELCQIHSV